MIYRFGKYLIYLYLNLLFRMRYEGLENIPADGGYILCSNHRSFYDPVFLALKEQRRLSFMAKEELFENKALGWLITKLGAFPVARGKSDTSAIDKSAEILRRGGVLTIFPEGTRSKDGYPLRARSGVAVISKLTWANVLCCSIDYGHKLKFRTTVTLRYHPVLTPEQMGLDCESTAAIKAGGRMVMDTIRSGLKCLPMPAPMPE